ncbi:MAG: AAA family ATPase, partial [Rhodobiaceae bacterium]|nr:AAA family ATPase [Rhodobiaceae bacterium]
MQIDVGYPDMESERRMLAETTGATDSAVRQILDTDELMAAQRLIRRIPVGDAVVEAILKIVRAARPGSGDEAIDRDIAWGPGPRASQALMLTVRARALVDGRLAPSLEDVTALAEPILKHRMAMTFSARAEGKNVSEAIAGLVGSAV